MVDLTTPDQIGPFLAITPDHREVEVITYAEHRAEIRELHTTFAEERAALTDRLRSRNREMSTMLVTLGLLAVLAFGTFGTVWMLSGPSK